MIVHVVLAFVAAVCATSVVTQIAPRPGSAKAHRDDEGRSALILACVFVLVLAAERGWYS